MEHDCEHCNARISEIERSRDYYKAAHEINQIQNLKLLKRINELENEINDLMPTKSVQDG